MIFVFERVVKEVYEVSAVDAMHAQEKLGKCEDLASYLVHSIGSEEFEMVGTRISKGNIIPEPVRTKRNKRKG